MDVSRAKNAADVVKMTSQLGKSIRKPTLGPKRPSPFASQEASESGLPPPVDGSGVVKILMYILAGILLIGVILLGVDQWITPIFQRVPGGKGYIPVPGNDMSQVYWLTPKSVADIVIGTPPTPTTVPGAPAQAQAVPLSTTVLEGQSTYSITMDVFIVDEFPQVDSSNNPLDKRVFFLVGATPKDNPPTLMGWLDNDTNTVNITSFTADGLQESVTIDNVPIHKPFRIGIVKSAHALEGYLNGLLVMTRPIKSSSKIPTTGSKIFAPANIAKSKGIKVLNVRTFGYPVEPSEMMGRMSDLVTTKLINPPPVVL